MARPLNQIKAEGQAAYLRGDREAAQRLMEEYKATEARSKASIAAEQARDRAISPLEGMSGLDKLHVGAASGLVNVGRRAGQLLLPKSLEERFGVSDEDIDSQRTTDSALQSTLPGAVGRFVTEAALTAPVGGAAGSAVKGTLGAVNLARTGRLAGLAAEGAAGGELASGDAGEGALFSLGLGGVGKLLQKAVRGSSSVTPEARRLMSEGVTLSPGQQNPQGIVAQFEQGLERVPGLGALAQKVRVANLEEAPAALFNRRFGASYKPGASFESMVEDTAEMLGKRYDNIRASMAPVKGGGGWELERAWRKAVNNPNTLASPSIRKEVGTWLEGQLSALKQKGQNVTAKDLLDVRQALRAHVRDAVQDGSREGKQLAKLFRDAEEELTQQIEHALPAAGRALLKETDAMYAAYKPLETAGFAAAARPRGAPTPGQLINAAKQAEGQSGWSGRASGRDQQFLRDLRDVSERSVRPTGAILPMTLASIPASLGLYPMMTKFGSQLHAGMRPTQRAAQAVIDNLPAPVRALIETLRRGTAGALTDSPEE